HPEVSRTNAQAKPSSRRRCLREPDTVLRRLERRESTGCLYHDGALPAPPIKGAGFGPTPARPHRAPAAPPRARYVVEHQPPARVRTLAEPAGIAAREQLRR